MLLEYAYGKFDLHDRIYMKPYDNLEIDIWTNANDEDARPYLRKWTDNNKHILHIVPFEIIDRYGRIPKNFSFIVIDIEKRYVEVFFQDGIYSSIFSNTYLQTRIKTLAEFILPKEKEKNSNKITYEFIHVDDMKNEVLGRQLSVVWSVYQKVNKSDPKLPSDNMDTKKIQDNTKIIESKMKRVIDLSLR